MPIASGVPAALAGAPPPPDSVDPPARSGISPESHRERHGTHLAVIATVRCWLPTFGRAQTSAFVCCRSGVQTRRPTSEGVGEGG
eukprot:scaffold343_cov120-Isochrysis_galbana.AAC.5